LLRGAWPRHPARARLRHRGQHEDVGRQRPRARCRAPVDPLGAAGPRALGRTRRPREVLLPALGPRPQGRARPPRSPPGSPRRALARRRDRDALRAQVPRARALTGRHQLVVGERGAALLAERRHARPVDRDHPDPGHGRHGGVRDGRESEPLRAARPRPGEPLRQPGPARGVEPRRPRLPRPGRGSPARSPAMTHPRVLVAEDDAQLRDLLVETLTRWDYDVTAAGNGDEALTLLDGRLFDVALLDMWLPGKDGLQLLEEIKRRDAALEVVMMTGDPMVSNAVHALKAGAYDYLIKPLN